MAEKRTVTARGKFYNLSQHLRSETYTKTIIATINSGEEHRLIDPRRSPAEHVYRTDCPHVFQLSRRKTITTVKTSPMGQSSTSMEGKQLILDELIVHLSDSVYEMYANWTMTWEFGIQAAGRFQIISQATITPHIDPIKWKTIVVGKAEDTQGLLTKYYPNNALDFIVTWSREESSPVLNSTQRELNDLKRAMSQMQTAMLESFNCPSIDITRLVFHSKRSGTIKHLCPGHSEEYSETQDTDNSQPKDQVAKPNEGLFRDDSDEEWDSDPEDVEPKKAEDLIFCHKLRALYFAPLRSTYREYCLPYVAEFRQAITEHRSPWPEWAKAHCTPHRVVPGFKTLTSLKSLYRLADMLIIPELKAICHKQIVDSLEPNIVFTEVKSSVFQQHEELRVEAYKMMRKNWQTYCALDIVPFITNLPQEESWLVFNHILNNLAPKTLLSNSSIVKAGSRGA
ncbi:uncharacterized protein MELLADRAFT_77319 [Melampsora larici-populina 98AG31]|uniref:BTB domain-containing protein n=1 Tax=Melampsora larici-populina (strain 98AG31 / pathotype 3-4-7) TaxID=747676 RepID=F4RGC6_MELLP|nr:uncharacterized protein MELLADRAFT_77319 [Melampsora larici-populina 98AG31]EGG08684.1 hypothetical protein MELLADRAFT_77319 [Melampsora larici-populina 98AG31]